MKFLYRCSIRKFYIHAVYQNCITLLYTWWLVDRAS